MNTVLLRKDLRENAGVFAMLGVLGLITLAVFLYAASDEGRFAALARFSAVWGFVLALVLGNRLFLQEQLSRTIELLEVLPISRATVFATKASLGAAIVVGTHAGAWATPGRRSPASARSSAPPSAPSSSAGRPTSAKAGR
jgi:ABC-type transport system involved in cytochrome c biogenesis permease component